MECLLGFLLQFSIILIYYLILTVKYSELLFCNKSTINKPLRMFFVIIFDLSSGVCRKVLSFNSNPNIESTQRMVNKIFLTSNYIWMTLVLSNAWIIHISFTGDKHLQSLSLRFYKTLTICGLKIPSLRLINFCIHTFLSLNVAFKRHDASTLGLIYNWHSLF